MKVFGHKIRVSLILPVSVLILGIYLLTGGAGSASDALVQAGHALVITSGIWLGCMTIVGILWKKYPWEFHPVKHLIIEVVAIAVYTSVFGVLIGFVEFKLGIFTPSDTLVMEIFVTLLITFFITAIHELVFFYKQWKHHFSRSVRLERDKIQAKYEALKTQVNPHFLFNSLNSLTTLVDDNENAVAYIQDLSEFLRYMLTSRDKDLVLLREELQLLRKYISLQESRFRDSLNINLDVPESAWHYALPPLILQMLVENCIKHNIISKENPLKVSIRANGNSIVVENLLQKRPGVTSTGQGLKNITGRYNLFSVREVRIEETATVFRVTIPLLTVEL